MTGLDGQPKGRSDKSCFGGSYRALSTTLLLSPHGWFGSPRRPDGADATRHLLGGLQGELEEGAAGLGGEQGARREVAMRAIGIADPIRAQAPQRSDEIRGRGAQADLPLLV